MKTSKRHGVNDARAEATTRLNIRVKTSAQQRLMIASVMSKRAPGDIVAELIETHLRAWRVQDNTTARGKINDRQDKSSDVENSVPPEPLQDAA